MDPFCPRALTPPWVAESAGKRRLKRLRSTKPHRTETEKQARYQINKSNYNSYISVSSKSRKHRKQKNKSKCEVHRKFP